MMKKKHGGIHFLKTVKAGYLVAVLIIIALVVFWRMLPGIVKGYVNRKLNGFYVQPYAYRRTG